MSFECQVPLKLVFSSLFTRLSLKKRKEDILQTEIQIPSYF